MAHPDPATASLSTAPPSPGTRYVPWLSWARIIAIVGVLTVHVFSNVVRSYGKESQLEWHFGNLADSLVRFGVPVFIMVSGAALLRRPPESESLRDFFVRRASRIAIPLVVWTAFYLWFDHAVLQGHGVTAYTFVQGYLWGRPFYHLYFLYVIAGLYLVTPFLRVFVAYASRRLVLVASLVCLGLTLADKLQRMWMGGVSFNAFSYFVPWIGYFLLGYVLATVEWRAARRTLLLRSGLLFAASVLATAIGTWILVKRLGAGAVSLMYDYFMPTTMLASVAVVVFLRVLTEGRAAEPESGSESGRTPFARTLADLTLGIYLLHPILLELIRRHTPDLAPIAMIGFDLLVVVVLFVVSGVATYGLKQIPVLRRLV